MSTHPGCNQYGHAPGCGHVTQEASGVDLLVSRVAAPTAADPFSATDPSWTLDPDPAPVYVEVAAETANQWQDAAHARATARDNTLTSAAAQEAHRQVAREECYLLTLGGGATASDYPLPPAGAIPGHAEAFVGHLRGDRPAARQRPLSAQRAEEIADYFYDRARRAAQADPAGLTSGPTPTNMTVNAALLVVARMRDPEPGSRFAHDAERSALRDRIMAEVQPGS